MRNINFNKIYWICFLVHLSFNLYPGDLIIILPDRNYIYEQNLSGFYNVFIEREGIKEIFMDEFENDKSIHEYISKALKKSVKKYVVTFSSKSAEFARSNITEATLIYSMVSSPRNLDLSRGNICGYELTLPYKNYFKVIKEINPNAKQVHALYSSTLGEYEVKGGEYQDLEQSLLMNSKKISREDDFQREMTNFLKGADAFLLVNDPIFDDRNFKLLSKYCKENKVLLLTNYIPLVDAGASVGIIPDYIRIGELTATLVNEILAGNETCDFGPFKSYQSDFLYINNRYIEESGFTLTDNFKKKVETFKDISIGIELFNKHLYKSARNTFEKILKRESNNETAFYYFKRVIEKLTYDETHKLFSEIDTLYHNKNYSSAKEKCKKILDMQPDNKQATSLLEKIQFSESEDIRSVALSFEKKNKPFLALKKYKESISICPTNQLSKNAFDNIKRTEFKKIPDYIKTGIEFYNRRHYKGAIEIFENILLLEPNNQNSLEYLRLSKTKEEALTGIIDCSTQSKPGCKLLE